MNKKNPQSLFKISPGQPCCLKQKSNDLRGYLGWGKSIGRKRNSMPNLGPSLMYSVMSEQKLQSELSLTPPRGQNRSSTCRWGGVTIRLIKDGEYFSPSILHSICKQLLCCTVWNFIKCFFFFFFFPSPWDKDFSAPTRLFILVASHFIWDYNIGVPYNTFFLGLHG